jgi:hypothetical protein
VQSQYEPVADIAWAVAPPAVIAVPAVYVCMARGGGRGCTYAGSLTARGRGEGVLHIHMVTHDQSGVAYQGNTFVLWRRLMVVS